MQYVTIYFPNVDDNITEENIGENGMFIGKV